MPAMIHARLSAAVQDAGIIDEAGVLAYTPDAMPLAGVLELAERAGLSVSQLFGYSCLRSDDDLVRVNLKRS